MKKSSSSGRKSTIFLDIICVLLILLIGFCGWKIYQQLKDYRDSIRLYDNLGSEYAVSASDTADTADPADTADTADTPDSTESAAVETVSSWTPSLNVNIAELKAQNPDVIGWIYFENDEISYPVMYSGDNDTYLHHAFDGSYATAGSIFMEGANTPDFSDSHTIIYGHNMRNLSMFGKLKYYYRDSNYYDSCPYFQIYTEDAVYRYHIFAYEHTSPDSFIYTIPYGDNDEFASFIAQIRSASLISPDIEVTSADRIITLSTCSGSDSRFVVHAVLESTCPVE